MQDQAPKSGDQERGTVPRIQQDGKGKPNWSRPRGGTRRQEAAADSGSSRSRELSNRVETSRSRSAGRREPQRQKGARERLGSGSRKHVEDTAEEVSTTRH